MSKFYIDRVWYILVDFCLQTINLVQDGQKEPVTCKCLDCDTITQAKQKALDAIYLNMPFTNRPSVHDVDFGESYDGLIPPHLM